jgi:uncharacterized membrane protein YfcA
MFTVNYVLFFIIVFLAHIMQGVTGFAGTLLAMPFSLMLVGYPVAKPSLNVLALLAGIYVFTGNRKNIVWRELWKIVLIMGAGILVGIYIKNRLLSQQRLMYLLLGIFTVCISLQGLYKEIRKNNVQKPFSRWLYLLLPVAGVVHGIFVCGGPLLIGYLTKKLPDKVRFRNTTATVWIFLNSIIFLDDLHAGYWTGSLVLTTLVAAPFLFVGMKVGTILYKRMSQHTFMLLSYVLLLVMGLKLLL